MEIIGNGGKKHDEQKHRKEEITRNDQNEPRRRRQWKGKAANRNSDRNQYAIRLLSVNVSFLLFLQMQKASIYKSKCR